MAMRISRTIFVLLIALSIVTLPTAMGFAAGSKTMESSTSEMIPDCDHHHRHGAPNDQTQKAIFNDACMGACAVACFAFATTDFSGIVFSLPTSVTLKLDGPDNIVTPKMGNLPFRPPRA